MPISGSTRERHGSSRLCIIAHGSILRVQDQYLVELIQNAIAVSSFLRLSQESHLSTTTTMTKQVYSYQRLSGDKPLGQVDIPLANLSSDGEEWVKSYSLEPFGRLKAGGRLGRWDKNSLESRTPALVRSILCVPRTSALTSKKAVEIKLMIAH